MRLWRMVSGASGNPGDEEERARFGDPEIASGAYAEVEIAPELAARATDGRCPECGGPLPRTQRTQPVRVRWPTNVALDLGDFVWPIASPFPLVARNLADELSARFAGFSPGPVDVLDHRIRASDGRPGARLPERFLAQAHELVELWIDRAVRPAERTTLREVHPPCPLCGLTQGPRWGNDKLLPNEVTADFGITILDGVEWWEPTGWEPGRGLTHVHHPREDDRGLYVDAAELGEPGFFVLAVGRPWPLCTDDVKAFVEERALTNVAFLEAGEVVGG